MWNRVALSFSHLICAVLTVASSPPTPWTLRSIPGASAMPGWPLIDASFDRVIPDAVISGCNLHDFQARVHAGLVVGWIHKPVALTIERGYGKGRLLATTFRLFQDAPQADPTATVLLHSL